ncbi:peptidylprolyl isomerase [Sediminicola luteus]|jgi:cyclophilin family peptidyl-prolyl cis-trans isomerase|uniref:peptidylprolyl isomerase n=1 Tax=Sediminicola luteus TaxID=319238 RepID=A0A2A4GA52_9FLAO|nr:peptidylprolyl isomerase [Sediminicola luteus]PCE64854.1 peptidylprolyl isomerase [Sediminicola luteus]
MKKISFLFLAGLLILAGCKAGKYADLEDGVYADIQTTRGDIVVKLEYEKTPVTVANFVSLAEGNNPFVSDSLKGKKFYDGIIFHRVIKDFMIQGGDPTGTGRGNPGYKFIDEPHDSLTHHKPGILSMANSGPKTNGCQFFITHKPTPHLNGRHTVFGEVVVGLDVVDSIANVKTAVADRPEVDVVMNKVEIIRNGKAAKKYDAVAIMTDYFAKEEELEKERAAKKAAFTAEVEKQRETAELLPSGLYVVTLKEGNGEKPALGTQADVHYAGYLIDGTLIDTSVEDVARQSENFTNIQRMHRGQFTPMRATFSPDFGLIAGFKEGMLNMTYGEKVRLIIPPHLGYGPSGSGPIPPNAELVFDLELLPKSE